jgi:hypothetical protein
MSKILFSESQIRQIIEKTNQIAVSNSGFIPISNLEDAAALAAYIAGYSSWKQYRKEQKKAGKLIFQSEVDVAENELKNFNIQTVGVDATDILELKERLRKNSHQKYIPEIKENKQLLYKIEVGQVYDKVTKATQICYLNLENTYFIGENYNFLKIAQNSLVEQDQTIIEFAPGNKGSDKLDPINEIFSGEYLEDFLSHGTYDNKSFSFIWGLLIKQIYEQYKIKFTADFLLKTLELDFVMKSWCMLYQEGNFLANMLMSYIKTLSQIKIEPSKIILSKESQEKHWENIKGINAQLNSLKQAYDENIFSYDGVKVLDSMIEKKSINISIPTKSEEFIFKVVDFIIDSSSRSYQKQVEGLDIKEHSIFLINKHEKITMNIIGNDYVFAFSQLLPHAVSKINNVEQVIFTRHDSFIEPSKEFLMKFYLSTSNVEKNLFANSGEVLIKMEDNISYLWKRESKEAEIGPFVMQRIAY